MAKELADQRAGREKLEKEYRDMIRARNKLNEDSVNQMSLIDLEAQFESLKHTKALLADKVQELQERLENEEEINGDYLGKKEKLQKFAAEQRNHRNALRAKLSKMEEDRDFGDNQARTFEDSLQS